MKLRDIGLKAKVMGAELIPIILAAILCGVVLVSLHSLLRNVEWVDDTHRVIRETVEIQADSMGMLAWLRGFHLSGDERLVQEYRRRVDRINKGFADLKRMVGAGERAKNLIQAEEILAGLEKNFEMGINITREINSGKSLNDLAALVATEPRKLNRFRTLAQEFAGKQQDFPDKPASDGTESTVGNSTAAHRKATDIYAAGLLMEDTERGYLLTGTDESLKAYEDASKQAFALIASEIHAMAANAPQLQLLRTIEDSLKEWVKDAAEPEIALRKQISASKTMADLMSLFTRTNTRAQMGKFDEALAAFKEEQEKLLLDRRSASAQATDTTRNILVLGLALVALASLSISYFIARAIANTVGEAVGLAEAISRGDYTRSLQVKGNDEVGRLTHALNEMVQYLREQTRLTMEGINILGSSAAEIAATVSQLGATASRTSAAVTETITTIEQMKQAAKVSNDTAKNVADSAKQAVNISETGKKAAGDTAHRMNLIKEQMKSVGETVVRLSEHSQAIEQIIGAVQDLADQSNLLAVNASIEAARAGDQGKGFAVVAHEIKSLADQSRGATEQVKTILEDTRKWVSAVVMATEQGTKAVDAGVNQSVMAGASIQSLFESVSTSSQAASVIYSSTAEQFAGVGQVSTAMLSIEQAMEQNVSSISQLEDAARRIEALGGSLKGLVERAKIQ